jgi:hypothetical protein
VEVCERSMGGSLPFKSCSLELRHRGFDRDSGTRKLTRIVSGWYLGHMSIRMISCTTVPVNGIHQWYQTLNVGDDPAIR